MYVQGSLLGPPAGTTKAFTGGYDGKLHSYIWDAWGTGSDDVWFMAGKINSDGIIDQDNTGYYNKDFICINIIDKPDCSSKSSSSKPNNQRRVKNKINMTNPAQISV